MKEKPIIFSSEMVRAILAGRKTQTRRVMNQFVRFPYGNVGTRLWVRESIHRVDGAAVYSADGSPVEQCSWKWPRSVLPSIYMPRAYSRIILEIVRVRAERLQAITDDDARSEGAPFSWRDPDTGGRIMASADGHARVWFSNLWDSINAKRGFAWSSNPWVWAVSFKLVAAQHGVQPTADHAGVERYG